MAAKILVNLGEIIFIEAEGWEAVLILHSTASFLVLLVIYLIYRLVSQGKIRLPKLGVSRLLKKIGKVLSEHEGPTASNDNKDGDVTDPAE